MKSLGSGQSKRVSRSRASRQSLQLMSEINVTPFVDVMLVLLIIFMITAPMLTVGIEIEIPESNAKSIKSTNGDETPFELYVNNLGEVSINNTDRSGIDEAVLAAKEAEIVIMILGEYGYQSGEGRSRANLDFPGLQQELLERVREVNKNIVLVIMSGRPLILNWADENIPSIVQAWHLGTQSGYAISEVLSAEIENGTLQSVIIGLVNGVAKQKKKKYWQKRK